ncbi:YdcF family protein [Actinomadura terrae]|uniref:YdcF family protein n=1 Tax=Actinomadura terrae TaxID=604353 RepID=UPI001FA6DA01|nr:YdcF family protein [Actinomadura terrae]
MTGEITQQQAPAITRFVDIQALPPDDEPSACFIFGTNQIPPVDIVADRYRRGLAPLIIVTGGVNRHNGIIEGQVFRRVLTERGVPDEIIRVEDQSSNTWQNVELALPFLHEAISDGLTIPQVGPFHSITWDPLYSGKPVTRQDWPNIPEGKRRVIREWEEVPRRVADRSLADVKRIDGAWH